MLKGKKSYIVAVLTLVYAVAGFFIGELDANAAVQLVLASGALAAVRNAIK